MAITCLSFEEAFNAVKGARDCVSVNCNFQFQLKVFEAIQLREVIFLKFVTSYKFLKRIILPTKNFRPANLKEK